MRMRIVESATAGTHAQPTKLTANAIRQTQRIAFPTQDVISKIDALGPPCPAIVNPRFAQ